MTGLRYGSDEHGLICGYRFLPDAAGVAIDLDGAVRWARGDDGPGFVWLHFNLGDASAENWICDNLAVVSAYFEALHEGSRSSRIENAHGNLIAVINDVAYEFAFDPSEIATLWLHVSPRLAVSARLHPLRSIDRLREAVRDGCRFDSPVSFLDRLMRDQGDVLGRIVREATVRVDDIEDQLLVGRLQNQRADLGKLRRVLVRLQRLLAPEPSALFRMMHQPPPWMTPHDLEQLRQATEEFTLIIRDVAELQERIKLLQEEIGARQGEQTSRSLFTLTVVTVLALPINIVAGLLGMNVGGIPLAAAPHGFLVIVVIVITFTLLAGWIAFRRRNRD